MNKIAGIVFVGTTLAFAGACTITSRTAEVKSMGTPISQSRFKTRLKSPGIGTFTKHIAADWAVSRAGLINLDDPKAKAAGLKDGDEPIQIYFYEFKHPGAGTYIVDSGISEKLKTNLDDFVPSLIQGAMKMEKFKHRLSLRNWLKRPDTGPLKGVFLTHMHLDHIMGLPDLPAGTPVYTGLNETTTKGFQNIAVRGTTDGLLGEKTRLVELKPAKTTTTGGEFAPAITDFFGDGSLFVVFVPGHTSGSLAYIIRAKDGLHMITGDTCHTAWGWKNGVTPGEYTADHALNQKSLNWLIALAKEFPAMKVHLGHQEL